MSGSRARSERYGERAPLTTREAFESRHDGQAASEWRRVTPPNDDDGMDFTEMLVAEFSNPDLYRLASLVPERDAASPGAPADYPHWALMAYGHLASAYGSHRKVHMALRLKHNWDLVLTAVAETAGQHLVDALSPKARLKGPSRNHWNYWFARHKHLWRELNEAYTPMAVAQAFEMGLLDQTAPRQNATPAQGNIVYGDGKVMTSPMRYRPRTKKPRTKRDAPTKRVDPAPAFWKEGGDPHPVYGTKFVFTSVRGSGHLNRVLLTMDLETKRGPGEAAIAMNRITQVVGLADGGVHAAVYDGAFSHKHIDPLMAKHGLLVVSPPTAASNPDQHQAGSGSKTRVEKEAHVETLKTRPPGGTLCEHRLYARGGQIGQMVTVPGHDEPVWEALPITGLQRREDKNGYRWYQQATVPCGVNGDHPYRLPLVQSSEDRSKGFLRSEYLRQLPPDTKGYKRTYGHRPSAESDNAQRENRFTWKRLPAYGPDGQALVMLGMNFFDNSRALYLHRKRQAAARQQQEAA